MNVAPLTRARLTEAARVLATACAFDQAAQVADEKLFGPGPASPANAFGVWDGARLVGVASVAARWLRVLGVVPDARGRGAGAALLAACETAARVSGHDMLSALAQPGNYLAPGVDERNIETLAWLEKRGFERGSEVRCNVLIDVRGNPRVTPGRAAAAAATARDHGYEIRRATHEDRDALIATISAEFSGAWHFEVERALGIRAAKNEASGQAATNEASGQAATNEASGQAATNEASGHAATNEASGHAATNEASGVHVAIKNGAYCAFAAHDGNNRGLGWFGPMGTWPAHRGQGLGEALLLACLVDVAAVHAQCEVAWIGPRPFYDKVAGIAGERRFVTLAKKL